MTLGTKVATFRYSVDGLVAVGTVSVLRPPTTYKKVPNILASRKA